MAESLGVRIKRLRQERELTLQAVADELGLTPAAISHWESGRITPKPKKLHELAKALSVSVGELTGTKAQTATMRQDHWGRREADSRQNGVFASEGAVSSEHRTHLDAAERFKHPRLVAIAIFRDLQILQNSCI